MLTLQVNTRSQPEKKGVSIPTRQTPTTPTSVPKSSPMQQHGTKAKVALLGPSSNSLDNLIFHLMWPGCKLSFSQLIVLHKPSHILL